MIGQEKNGRIGLPRPKGAIAARDIYGEAGDWPNGRNEGANPPLRTLFYARALPTVDVALHHQKRVQIDLTEQKWSRLIDSGEDVRERQSSEGNHHQTYAIAAACIRHSHSIVPGGFEV